MPVYVRNAQRKCKINTRGLKKQLLIILDTLGCRDRELSVLFAGDARIRKLNARYRDIDRPTDVLSFPQSDGNESASALLGDVVVSVETAQRQARDHNLSFDQELLLLLIHGTLHLLGYDHEKSRAEAGRMKRKTLELFQTIFPEGNVTGAHFF
ncbi:MAG: rRNA maturation RNase YbeY [Nitrospinales bacterium]